MGFYLRKALRAGPLRFNLSKHGLGVSVGVPGFRVGLIGPRGHYVQMGRKGLYYRSTLGARQPSAVHQVTRSYHQPAVAPPQSYDIQEPSKPIMQDVTGATVLQMAASTPSVLVEQLTAGQHTMMWWGPALGVSVVVALVALIAFAPAGIILAAVLGAGVWWLRQRDVARRAVVVYYDVSDEYADRYEALVNAFGWLQSAQRTRWVTAEGRTNMYQYKVHAGASTVVRSGDVKLSIGRPSLLVTNIAVPAIASGPRSIYFLPDRVILRERGAYADIAYSALGSDATQIRWIEDQGVPSDSRTVDSTWRYVNKSGGPDRRFKNNRQLPIALYSELHLWAGNGLNAIYQFSNPDAAAYFERALDVMRTAPRATDGAGTCR